MVLRAFKSLQVRVTLATVLLIFGGLAAFALLIADRQEARLRELLAEQQLSTVGYVADDIDAKIRLRVSSLTRIATQLGSLQLSDAPRLEAFLADRQAIYDLFELGLIVARADLSAAYADFPAMRGRRTSNFRISPFKDVVREGKPVVGPPMKGRHVDRPVVVIAVPVTDRDGKLVAVLAGATGLDANNFLDLVAGPRLGRVGDFLVVAPKAGVIVTGTNPGNALKPLPGPEQDPLLSRLAADTVGSVVGVNGDGIEELMSVRDIPVADWRVAARIPTAQAFAPVHEFRRLAFGTTAMLALLVGLVAAVVLRRALAPLTRAASVFDAISAGRRPLLALPVERDDEIGRLMESFNRLQQSLNEERDALRDSEDKLRTLVQAIPDSVQLKDDQGRWLEYNVGAQRAFGLEGVDCRGLGEAELADLVSPAVRPGLLQCGVGDEIAWQSGQACRSEESITRPDGGRGVFDVIKIPLYHDDGSRKSLVVVGRDITEIRHASEALKRSLRDFNHLVEQIPVGVFKLRMRSDGSESFDYVSPRWCELTGVSADEVLRDATVAYRPVHPDDVESMRERNRIARDRVEPFHWEGRLLDGAGNVRWMRVESTPTVLSNGDVLWEGIQYDISERHRAEDNLRLVASVFRNAREGICITDANERIIDVNPTFCEMTGYEREEVIGKTPRLLKSGHHGRQFYMAMWQAIRRHGFWRGEIWNRHRGGGLRVQLLTISSVRGDEGNVSHYLGVFSDITQMKENEKQLERLAHYDVLTGIPNRLLLADRLQQAITQARRNGTLLAICLLDLDDFKMVNDTFGHEAGDRLLVEVTRRLQLAMRTCDTVARLGGDEFVFLLAGLNQVGECEAIVDRLMADLTEHYAISGHLVNIVASVGIALFPHDGIEPDTLMRHADEAMYAAKNAGGNRYRLYDSADRNRD